jgi:hypothetical protein
MHFLCVGHNVVETPQGYVVQTPQISMLLNSPQIFISLNLELYRSMGVHFH